MLKTCERSKVINKLDEILLFSPKLKLKSSMFPYSGLASDHFKTLILLLLIHCLLLLSLCVGIVLVLSVSL